MDNKLDLPATLTNRFSVSYGEAWSRIYLGDCATNDFDDTRFHTQIVITNNDAIALAKSILSLAGIPLASGETQPEAVAPDDPATEGKAA